MNFTILNYIICTDRCCKNLIIWKMLNNNNQTFAYYKNNHLNAYVNFKVIKSKIKFQKCIGSTESLSFLTKMIDEVLINEKQNTIADNFYVYQIKKDTRNIKKIINNKNLNVQPLNISSLFTNHKIDCFKSLPYVENGMSFWRIDV